MTLTYSAALLVLFFLLLVAEFFVPSAGLVGVAAAVCAVCSIVIAFTHSFSAGFVVMSIVGVSTPLILYTMIRLWPYTWIGKKILNRRPGQVDPVVEARLRSGEKRSDLIGRTGLARTNLLPAGQVVINGTRLDAVSEGSPIDAGTRVVVISVIAGKIRVRPAGETDVETEGEAVERKAEHIERSLESLDLDSMAD